MRLELYGTPDIPVSVSAIASAISARSNSLYGELQGIEKAAEKIAEGLLAIAEKEKGFYVIVVSLRDDGDYYFGVRAPRTITQRPRCHSWLGPEDYILEIDCLPCGGPFNKHLLTGWL